MSELIELYNRSLFDHGPMKISPETYLAEKEADYRSMIEGKGTPRRIDKLVEEMMIEERYSFPWLVKFSGKIPAHWEDWQKIIRDLTIAGGLTVKVHMKEALNEVGFMQLGRVLVDSAVCHPHWAVRRAAGENQFLEVEQLAMVMAHPQPGRDFGRIQRNQLKGFGPAVIDRAEVLKTALFNGTLSVEQTVLFRERFVLDYLTSRPYAELGTCAKEALLEPLTNKD